jgi:hypothetical protein
MHCELQANWGSVPDWIAAIAAFGTLIVAIVALLSWHKQLTGATRHNAAAKIAEASYMLRDQFYHARNPAFMAWEFPESYWNSDPRSDATEARGYQHVYNARLKVLWPYIIRLAKLRGRTIPLLGAPVADAMERLARKSRALEKFMSYHVKQLSHKLLILWWAVKDSNLRPRD